MRPPFLDRRRCRVQPLYALSLAGAALGALGLAAVIYKAVKG